MRQNRKVNILKDLKFKKVKRKLDAAPFHVALIFGITSQTPQLNLYFHSDLRSSFKFPIQSSLVTPVVVVDAHIFLVTFPNL